MLSFLVVSWSAPSASIPSFFFQSSVLIQFDGGFFFMSRFDVYTGTGHKSTLHNYSKVKLRVEQGFSH